MKSCFLALAAILAFGSVAHAQTNASDQRCSRHFVREQVDRCNCTAQSGGVVIGVDSKGFNRWNLPQAKAGEFVACMKRKGYRT